jgi:OOP family OmpA-OmpF porin
MDGITDCNDRCPNTLRGQAVDAEGCPLPEVMEPKPFRG